MKLDVKSTGVYPSSKLSNFAPNRFIFDGVECASMEGLLQSFKFDKIEKQREICGLVGYKAKSAGSKRNAIWQRQQSLWWNGYIFPRNSRAYQNLIDNAFDSMYEQSKDFREALYAANALSHEVILTHNMGSNDNTKTILTEKEFCVRLNTLMKRRIEQDDR